MAEVSASFRKINNDVYESLKAQWFHVFRMYEEALLAGDREKAKSHKIKLIEVFDNTADGCQHTDFKSYKG